MEERVGHCRLIEQIGSGGMAVVFKGIQEPLGRTVAVKTLKGTIAIDSQFAKRFEREAMFMATLQHENILHVYDFLQEGDSLSIVMEYVTGIDLHALLEKAKVLPVDVAVIVALQVARALEYAHFRGIIHRDVKPSNILVSYYGEVKLTDFGVAHDEREPETGEPSGGIGTPSYMSPEQILGDKVDFRTDIFSLGIILYQMVTGMRPFQEDDARSVMQKIRLDRYVPPRSVNPNIPRTLERIIARCMEKQPANRYPTMQVLIEDLMEFLSSRLLVSYNARLVLFLQEVGVLSEVHAGEILSSGSTGAARRRDVDRYLVRAVASVSVALFMLFVLGATLTQLATGGFGHRAEAASLGLPVLPAHAGYVRVVAEPWAHVTIDGQNVMTTPVAQPIALAPGRHYLRFSHPDFGTVDRVIRIHPEKTEIVHVTMGAER